MKRHWFSLLCSVFVSLRPTVPARSLHNRHNRGADSVVGPTFDAVLPPEQQSLTCGAPFENLTLPRG
jgi:hypothetical protein